MVRCHYQAVPAAQRCRPTAASARRTLPPASLTGFLAALTAGWACAPAAQAFDPREILSFRAGPVLVRPQVSTMGQYNDNIYRLQPNTTNMVDDVLFMVAPGLTAALGEPEADHQINFSYRFTQTFYLENDISNSGDHTATLGATFRGARLSYSASHSLNFGDTIYGTGGVIDEATGVFEPLGNVERLNFSLNHRLTYELNPKNRAYLGVLFGLRDFGKQKAGPFARTRPLFDSDDWKVTGGYDRTLSDKTALFSEVFYGQQTQTPNLSLPPIPSADSVGGFVGLRGNPTPKLSGSVKAGYQHRWFSDNEGDHGFLVADATISYQFDDRSSANLRYGRSGSVSAQGAKQTTVTDSVGLGLQRSFGYRRPINFTVNGSYNHTQYQGNTAGFADADYFGVDVSLARQITQWMVASLNYAFEKRQGGYDYDVNRVSLSVNIGY